MSPEYERRRIRPSPGQAQRMRMVSNSHRSLKYLKSQDLDIVGIDEPNDIKRDKRLFYKRPEVHTTETQASTNFEDSNDSFT
jgi:hypothetical protein